MHRPYPKWPTHHPFRIRLRDNDPRFIIEFLFLGIDGSLSQKAGYLHLIDHEAGRYLLEPPPPPHFDVSTHGVNIVLAGIEKAGEENCILPLLTKLKEVVQQWGVRKFDCPVLDIRTKEKMADFEVKLSIFGSAQ